jgi:glycosyltransferase involved in cell wall biosynthesis
MRSTLEIEDSSPRAVVVLAGARDHYQLPLALNESDLLHTLVTDLYLPAQGRWFSFAIEALLPRALISTRFCSGLDSKRVRTSKSAFITFGLMKAAPKIRFNRIKDRALSRKARLIALRNNAPLFSYSYYASESFKPAGEIPKRRFLFQLHPHPRTVREILQDEISRAPNAKQSLRMEHELSLIESDFEELADEPHLANGWVVASSYTARTLSDHRIPSHRIHVVPYGVDGGDFAERTHPPDPRRPFTVAYVGSLVQRKGLSYLLDALRRLKTRHVRLVLCGRGFVDQQLLRQYSDLNLKMEVNIGLSRQELVRRMHEADVVVLPSLAEGFAHVILEAMSCGLPVIATTHTCAPDVMIDGKQGFIVPIRDSEKIVERLAWAMDHRAELASMGEAAALQARLFTWERFRSGVREAYRKMVASVQ